MGNPGIFKPGPCVEMATVEPDTPRRSLTLRSQGCELFQEDVVET